MNLRRVVFMYQERFVAPVFYGRKPTTIRPVRKRKVNVGDIFDNRRWTGKPYCSKQERIGLYECVEARKVTISPYTVILFFEERSRSGVLGFDTFLDGELDTFAREDGFAHWDSMKEWFEYEHGLPFTGMFYRFKPIPEPLQSRLCHYFDKGKNCGNCAKGRKCFAVCASHCRDWTFNWEGWE